MKSARNSVIGFWLSSSVNDKEWGLNAISATIRGSIGMSWRFDVIGVENLGEDDGLGEEKIDDCDDWLWLSLV